MTESMHQQVPCTRKKMISLGSRLIVCCKLAPTLARQMWRHNYVINCNEYLIFTLSESINPWVYSLQFLFKSSNNSWRYERKCEWVFFFWTQCINRGNSYWRHVHTFGFCQTVCNNIFDWNIMANNYNIMADYMHACQVKLKTSHSFWSSNEIPRSVWCSLVTGHSSSNKLPLLLRILYNFQRLIKITKFVCPRDWRCSSN